ncbi:hypothetical protein Csp2054_14915 [Curtobacterium sp. 'Ferrero']|uniref:hypothetical protein n=1 Tax=Curtobacterium sp. 'Ferrero' TaxID=2033654 RepID=UPI000BCD3AAA|nr:hypothetical protein [Curtobacterium sp. 'Ferrero']PCN46885.1 hypothetical protein Csp2054_14915 [Curtobacterium sp. 'Ferrero']
MDTTRSSGTTRRRVELRITRPPFTWFARPTVTIDGVGHPAQWGTGTWAVPDEGGTRIGVYLYNRVWRFGAATRTVTADDVSLVYRAGPLPVGAGRLDGA